MLLRYSRRLTGKVRSRSANAELACFLSFVAGAINAGGFLAVQQYTSHMSGIVSHMSDMVALGDFSTVLWGFGALLAFIAGAASTTVIINFARHRYLQSEYALPILIEAGALMFFGLLDGIKWDFAWLWTSLTVATLCYIMGLQNAIITDISQYALRSTHITGTVTDIGIELGKAFYWNRASRKDPTIQPVQSNKKKFKLLVEVLILFFIGGLVGAYGFKSFGFMFTCAMASILVYLAAGPIIDDIKTLWTSFNEPPVVRSEAEDINEMPTTAEMAEAEEQAELEEQQETQEYQPSGDEHYKAGT
ncbi:MAG: YoaK family protein [Pelistega sp.]|nr:YoaK family protein [Pelistega sp.]